MFTGIGTEDLSLFKGNCFYESGPALGGYYMEKLARIMSLDNFRFFGNYRWNKDLKPFAQRNIIYGWNGCGKSTLCDFFAFIERGEEFPNQCAFEFRFQEDGEPERTIKNRDINAVANRFRVYHQHYAQGLVSRPNNINHIYIIGHEEGEAAKQVEKLKKEKIKLEKELEAAKKAWEKTNIDFENYRRERATTVRNITQYGQGYNYKRIYDRYKEIESPTLLSDSEYKRLLVSVNATQKERIIMPQLNLLSLQSCNEILNVLMESPVYTTIERLQQNIELREWVRRGFDIHKKSNTAICEFCQSPILPDRWNALEDYFSDSLTKFRDNTSTALNLLENGLAQFKQLDANLPHETQFFDEYIEEYRELRKQVNILCSTYIAFISKTIELVTRKSEKIVDTSCAEEFRTLLANVDFNYSVLDTINSLVEKHNLKASNFEQSIEKDTKKLEIHIIAESSDNFKKYEQELFRFDELQKEYKKRINELKNDIEKLDEKVKNSRIPADIINKDIKFIFGHNDLYFEWKENGYEIRRHDEIATNLSTGEQNAIALIYFFNSLLDSGISKENTIVILDDPVSSFDSNYYYSAVAYIRDKLDNVGQAFIFTHKFSLYKDLSRMFGKCHKYLLERENNGPTLKEEDAFLRDYEDEYMYLFKKIYEFTKNPPANIQDYLPYPNMGRRLLESFISFKLPEKNAQQRDILTKAIKMEKAKENNTERIRALTRLVQNQSHLRKIKTQDNVDNILDIKQLPDIFHHLLRFIETHDEVHYNTLVTQIDSQQV
jgi:wobble nucleotide-excising tRNase